MITAYLAFLGIFLARKPVLQVWIAMWDLAIQIFMPARYKLIELTGSHKEQQTLKEQ